jgi:hypothetical protein
MILDSGEGPPIEAHGLLSTMCEGETSLAALALSKLEYPVSQYRSAGAIAREEYAAPALEFPQNELGKVAAFLS